MGRAIAITTRDQLVAAAKNPVTLQFSKPSLTVNASPGWRLSTWANAGTGLSPVAGSAAVQAPMSSNSLGAPPIPAALAAGNTWYLAGLSLGGAYHNGIMLLDRYAMQGGLSTSANSSVFNLVLPARAGTDYSGGQQIYIECYGATSTTGLQVAVSYYNQAGVTQTTQYVTLPNKNNSAGSGTYGPIPLAAGDTGVQGVRQLLIGASAGAAGSTFAVVIAKPMVVTDTHQYLSNEVRLGWEDIGLINVGADPCFYFQIPVSASGTLQAQMMATITLVQG